MAEAKKILKKPKRRTLMIISVAVLIIVIAGAGVFIFMGGQQRMMKPIDTGEFLSGIYAIKTGSVNMFLIEADGKYIAVDAGSGADAVEKGLSQLGVGAGDVAAVLLTHTHGDHTAGLKLFSTAAVCGADKSTADHFINDGDTILLLGVDIQVISTPGHADDSVCYLFSGKYLFAGDNLSLVDGKVGLFNSVFNKSDEQQKADIDKLSKLENIEYVITAHYGYAANPVYP